MYTLVYKSLLIPSTTIMHLDAIQILSSLQNRKFRIRGCLYVSRPYVLQILQGPQDDVDRLYQNILLDRRHYSVTLMFLGEYKERVFAQWSMKKIYITENKLRTRFVELVKNNHNQDLITDIVELALISPDW
ncbi:MAG: BLUF domain-containing protein [Zetaproteobacteria bacterium]|nr:BLUF domain-containing protein [Zetaproteobacteria bacterium]